jgi:hypothetical protein
MGELSNQRYEAFAQGRCRGLGVMEAYRAAGYEGDSAQAASRISQHPEVKGRLLELHNAAGSVIAYERAEAIRDLVGIIKARPCDAAEEHPLCEVRSGKAGKYHRFPSKLRAMARLIRIMGWAERAGRTDAEAGEKAPDRMRSIMENATRSGANCPWTATRHRKGASQHDGCGEEDTEEAEERMKREEEDDTCVPPRADGLLTPRQEAYAQGRARGLSVMKAYQAAGYQGHSAKFGPRIQAHPAVQGRIEALREMATKAEPDGTYKKHEAINDLITIIRAAPVEANEENPLCETRMGVEGLYYRFPCKIHAFSLLARVMGWEAWKDGDASGTAGAGDGVGVDERDGLDRFFERYFEMGEDESAGEEGN